MTVVEHHNLLDGETVGILAGWGRFPVAVAEAVHRRGGKTAILSIRHHANAMLQDVADYHGFVGVAEIGKAIDFFRRTNCDRATMAGKVHKSKLFGRHAWIRHFPDWVGLKTFWPHFISRKSDNRDDSLLGAITNAFDGAGVRMVPATDLAPELLASEGVLVGRPLTSLQEADVLFGWQLAKKLGQLDVGQTVVVKNKAPMALEAIEGTDECIRRAGRLCEAGGMVVVKVAKPQQDFRFDMPTIGVGTIQSLREAGATVLAVEAGKTILVDVDELISFARRSGISIVCYYDDEGHPSFDASVDVA
ncbi:MAG: UDP-2,3-diacylglucosamine diphosphatase LpxI [Pirellulales bacterium]|nr:UDP-2,3-diacylglucosamine diphosphatase LpxI [Pirellulales bacterium]